MATTAATTTAPYAIDPTDPLAEAHGLVSAWVEAAIASLPPNGLFRDVDLASIPAGAALVNLDAPRARSAILAAIAQVQYWEETIISIRSHAPDPGGCWPPGYRPRWYPAWGRTRQSTAVIHALLRRSLAFEAPELVALIRWCRADRVEPPNHDKPFSATTQTIRRFVERGVVGPELQTEMLALACQLGEHPTLKMRRLGIQIAHLVPTRVGSIDYSPPALELQAPPEPATAGEPRVLVALKTYLGVPSQSEQAGEPVGEVTLVGADQFSLAPDSPLAAEHGWLTELLAVRLRWRPIAVVGLPDSPISTFLRNQEPAAVGRLVLAAAERQIHSLLNLEATLGDREQSSIAERAMELIGPMAALPFTLDRAGLFDFLLYLSVRGHGSLSRPSVSALGLVAWVEAELAASKTPLTEGERYVLALWRAEEVASAAPAPAPEVVAALTRLIGDGAEFFLTPGEVWADAANADLTALPPERRAAWVALLTHAAGSSASRPTAKWLAEAGLRVAAIGTEAVAEALERWLPLVGRGRSVRVVPSDGWNHRAGDLMIERNAATLKGLLWLAPTLADPGGLARGLGSVAQSAYRKVPGVGARAIKVGNAAVAALAALGSPSAVGQLALLKVRVKFGSAQLEISKAFDRAAQALGLPRDEIEELGVPTYGLDEVGRRRETLGACRAELIVDGNDATLQWRDAKGKAVKSVPAGAKRDYPDEVKELQAASKDIAAMLPAQRDRIDALFLLQRSWPVAAWRERYADHPLVGTIARRLIWRVDGTATLWHDGTPTDLTGAPVTVGPESQVTPWHPVECPTSEVLAWRERLERLRIRQPFKQAHREVYLLTDAERRTATYSNRFAGHVVRQHQMNALAAARGWRTRLRMMVDDSCEPPTRELAPWGLRAEYWVEGAGDQYGTDSNEAGAYLRLLTDQVRFYRLGAAANRAHVTGGPYQSQARESGRGASAEPVPLDQIPALVLSEVMRDVDLFVGVGSVGNDPTWQDGGPEGRYRDYWQGYSFGELSGTARTRRAVLERLVPRLKIGPRCSFTDRFLRVEGTKRAYKIHLGSGNILMEPNDQYLCIVPDAQARARSTGDLFLPFEGDALLSVILSKALLLAADSQINDPTITRQIDGR